MKIMDNDQDKPDFNWANILTPVMLIFLYPLGLIPMWFWTRWPKWLKLILTLPIEMLLLFLVFTPILDSFRVGGPLRVMLFLLYPLMIILLWVGARGSRWMQILLIFPLGLVLLGALAVFVTNPHKVSGNSMEPNYPAGAYYMSDRFSYLFREPSRGEVVNHALLEDPDGVYIARIVGLPGEKVRISGGVVYINNAALSEPYLTPGTVTDGGQVIREGLEFTVPAGQYMLLGDNRSLSTDSRERGFVPRRYILERAMMRYR